MAFPLLSRAVAPCPAAAPNDDCPLPSPVPPGAILLGSNVESGYCVYGMASYLYQSFYPPLLYMTFLAEFFSDDDMDLDLVSAACPPRVHRFRAASGSQRGRLRCGALVEGMMDDEEHGLGGGRTTEYHFC